MSKPYVLGIDPSGNFVEGKGVTGFALLAPSGKPVTHFHVDANKYNSRNEYWTAILNRIIAVTNECDTLVLSVEDFVLYKTKASAQINSQMETSKLLGVIEYFAYEHNLPIKMRTASAVKSRWSNDILIHKGLLIPDGKHGGFRCGDDTINHHSIDALRHAVHCHYFECK